MIVNYNQIQNEYSFQWKPKAALETINFKQFHSGVKLVSMGSLNGNQPWMSHDCCSGLSYKHINMKTIVSFSVSGGKHESSKDWERLSHQFKSSNVERGEEAWETNYILTVWAADYRAWWH